MGGVAGHAVGVHAAAELTVGAGAVEKVPAVAAGSAHSIAESGPAETGETVADRGTRAGLAGGVALRTVAGGRVVEVPAGTVVGGRGASPVVVVGHPRAAESAGSGGGTGQTVGQTGRAYPRNRCVTGRTS